MFETPLTRHWKARMVFFMLVIYLHVNKVALWLTCWYFLTSIDDAINSYRPQWSRNRVTLRKCLKLNFVYKNFQTGLQTASIYYYICLFKEGGGEFWTIAPWKIGFRLFFTEFFISWRWLYFEQLPKKKYNGQSFIQLWATKPQIFQTKSNLFCVYDELTMTYKFTKT